MQVMFSSAQRPSVPPSGPRRPPVKTMLAFGQAKPLFAGDGDDPPGGVNEGGTPPPSGKSLLAFGQLKPLFARKGGDDPNGDPNPDPKPNPGSRLVNLLG